MVLVGGKGHCRICGKQHSSDFSCKPGPLQIAQISIEGVEALVSEIHLNEKDRKKFRRWCEEIRQVLGIPPQPVYSADQKYAPKPNAISRARELQDYMLRLIERYGYMVEGQFTAFQEALGKMKKTLGLQVA